ncbi:MAG: MscL family protein [Candidatus Bathyarchaeia archaeon]
MSKEDKMLEELKKIRELLTPKAAPSSPPPKKGMWGEFKEFLSKYKVMGLAVAFIMAIYLGNLVQTLVKGLIMPLIGLVVPGLENLATFEVPVMNQKFLVGDFLVALITFIIIAFVIFMLVKLTKRWGIE